VLAIYLQILQILDTGPFSDKNVTSQHNQIALTKIDCAKQYANDCSLISSVGIWSAGGGEDQRIAVWNNKYRWTAIRIGH